MNNLDKKIIYIFIIIIIFIIIYNYFSKCICRSEHFNNNQCKIPKNIYQCYKSFDDLDQRIINCSCNKIKEYNKNYNYKFLGDKNIELYIKNSWGQTMLDIYKSIDNSYGACKSDFFRYLYMYEFGGIYLDAKSSIKSSFDNVIKPNDSFVLTYWDDYWGYKPNAELLNNEKGEFINWFIACEPKHIFLKNVIKNVVKNILLNIKNKSKISGKYEVLKLTGPIIYSQSIADIIKNNKNVNYRIVDDYSKLNLVYACEDHFRLMKNHYTKSNKNILNYSDKLANINIDNFVNSIFN